MKIKKIVTYIVFIILIGVIIVCLLSLYVKLSTKKQILELDELKTLEDVDCIIVLGSLVTEDKPSPMLEERLIKGIELYNEGVSPKIIMSGDHGQKNYNEVGVMKTYAIEEGVDSSNIFMDHAGFSTYDSIYRAKEIFGAKKIVIVTQEYHLYRSLYIANALGLEAYGYKADIKKHRDALKREIREILARDKDIVKSIIKPESTYVGEPIPVNGNGDTTNDTKED